MVSKGHLEISKFIKKVHEDLREKSNDVGLEKAWKEHCADREKLEKYALAMKELATNYWEKSCSTDSSRISWAYQASLEYYTIKIHDIRLKESEIANKINNKNILFNNSLLSKWKLLDVGSCYNPFKQFEIFEVIAIDIAPAVKDVFKCDFLQVQLSEILELQKNEVNKLPQSYFDIIVFSLFLEYLPSPLQRKLSCKKAYNLLKPEGILLIITPDSNHVGSNSKLIKSYRFILAKMGFSRIKYEKLKHIHCMVFRKSPIKEVPIRWADIHQNEQAFDEIYIPQDFKNKSENKTSFKLEAETILELNKELPFSTVFK